MRRIARFSVRHRGPVLVAWALALVAGFVFAGDARDDLHSTDLQIPGTQSERAARLTEERFGGTISMAVLLKGPSKLLEERGPAVVRRLERIEGVDVLSPWAIGGARVLREPSGQALLTLQVRKPFEQIADETTPEVDRVLGDSVRAPIKWEVTGLAPLVRAINQASVDSVAEGERRAFPVLLLLLLLIFRSPIAALVPVVCGILVSRIGMAAMGVLNQRIEVDALALNIVTMIGLALGVDYSLLIVSRFREELASGADVNDAVEQALFHAGKTVLFAGTALVAGMLCAIAVVPGALLVSAGMGVIVAAVFSVLAALFLIPAGLAVIGTGVNRWQFSFGHGAELWVRFSQRMIRRPALAAALTLLPLLALALPALALDTGPPNVANLPEDNPSRMSYEAFERDRGAGWSTPFEVTFSTRGPITTTKRLRALKRFQQRVAREPGVDAVLGPAVLLERTAVLRRITRQITTGGRRLLTLERGLRRVRNGTGSLRDGLGAAVAGASALVNGLERAANGSSLLAGGVSSAAPQTTRLASGVQQTSSGAQKVADSLTRVENGAVKLEKATVELARILEEENASAEAKLTDPLNRAHSNIQAALRHFGDASAATAADPSLVKAKEAVQAALAELGPLQSELLSYTTELGTNAVAAREMADAMTDLSNGLTKLSSGSERLDDGIEQTAAGAAQLASEFKRLDAGTSALRDGLLALVGSQGSGSGARALASGLQQAFDGTNRLGRGVQRVLDGVVRVRQSNDSQMSELRRGGSDVGRATASGYFVLAAVEGSKPDTQTNVAFATNTPNGGNTARVIVVPQRGPFDPASSALRPALERHARETAKQLGSTGVVGGPAVVLNDFDEATSARFPLLVIVLVLATFLVLLVVFHSPVLSLIAVALNLVTAGATVGVLVLLFQTDTPLLGGPGYLDAVALLGIFAVVFGLAIDYQVFLISRLLEGHDVTGTTDGAIRYSLEKTATIITGAALVMAGVFLAFAASGVANTRQFGVGLTVAVMLDATVVRLVLLPALIKLFGDRAWAVPARLSRVLPRFHGY